MMVPDISNVTGTVGQGANIWELYRRGGVLGKGCDSLACRAKTRDRNTAPSAAAVLPSLCGPTQALRPDRHLCRSAFGTVYEVEDLRTGELFAVKQISKAKLACTEDVEDVRREMQVWRQAGHG